MAMNRETKRMLQRQGALGCRRRAQGHPRRPRPPPRPKEKRTPPRQFLREVRAELRKVAWPTRSEVINYSIIVFITIVVLTAFIAVLDWASSEAVLWLFDE